METDRILATGSVNVDPKDYGTYSGSAEHGQPDHGSPGSESESGSPLSAGDNESCPGKGGECERSDSLELVCVFCFCFPTPCTTHILHLDMWHIGNPICD